MSTPSHGSKLLKLDRQVFLESENSTESLVTSSRKWIEECTGCIQSEKSFMEYLQDGIMLCELMQSVAPGMIRKINRIRNPFAWRENISLFLAACSKLGLRESQLFSPEDIVTTSARPTTTNLYKAKGSLPGSQQSLRNVALTLCYLAVEVQSQEDYTGPHMQLPPGEDPPIFTSQEVTLSPSFTTVSAFSSSSSLVSHSDSKTRRVESVTNLITETSSTDIQSYAELVLYLNGSNKEYSTISKPPPLRLTQSFNSATYASKTSKVQRTLSDRTPLTTRVPQNLLQESISDINIPTLQADASIGCQHDIGESRESFEGYSDYRDFDSTTTPSDASTVIYREILSSRCSSNQPITSEDCIQEKDKSIDESSETFPDGAESETSFECKKTLKQSESEHSSVGVSHSEEVESLTGQGSKTKLEVGDIRTQPEAGEEFLIPAEKENLPKSEELKFVELSLKVEQNPKLVVVNNSEAVELISHSEDLADRGSGSSIQDPLSAADSSASSLVHSERSRELVTDIHNSNTTSLSEGTVTNGHFGGDDSFKQAVNSKEKMEQIGSSHVLADSPVGLNGIRTHGYASNGGSKDVYSLSTSVVVPHHSLTLATSSDPDSPSSYQLCDKGEDVTDSTSRHQNFEMASAPSSKRKKLTLGDLDLTRVKSDALPQSMHPSMVTFDKESSMFPHDTSTRFEANSPDSQRSDSSLERESLNATTNDFTQENLSPTMKDKRGSLPLRTSSNGRPMSAPNRSSSSGTISGRKSSSTLPHVTGTEFRMREKRMSLDVERQKRILNIHESARAALQYSANRRSSKADSLPRDSRSGSLTHSILSTGSEEDIPHSNTRYRKSSSPTFISPPPLGNSSIASNSANDGVSTPLNLRHLSIDETKEASLTQMDEIWRQVEAIADTKSSTSYRPTKLTPNAGSDISKDGIPSLEPVNNNGIEFKRTSDAESRLEEVELEPDVLRETDISISIVEPVGQSTPLRRQDEGVASTSVAARSSLLDPSLIGVDRSKAKNRPTSFSSKDIDSLLDTLKSFSSHEENEDLKILEEMLKSNVFKMAKHVHDDMKNLLSGTPPPAQHRILPSTQLMREHLHHHTEPSSEVDELRTLLRSPHLQAVLFCHDKVSTHDLYVPDAHFHRGAHDPVDIILSPSINNFQMVNHKGRYSGESSRDIPSNRKEGATIVSLERTNRPLGCTIYKQDDAVFIGRLLKGCDAEASDMLCEGDELLEVNGVPVMGKTTDEILRLMSGDVQPGAILAFTVIPVHDESYDIDYETKYIRAHFDYSSHGDDEIPCKALGITFQKGDIMEIINQDDPNWWQACKVFDENAVSLPGLIPSMHLQQQREAMVHSYQYYPPTDTKKGIKGMFSRKKKKKIYYQNTTPSNILGIGDEIPTYEEVYQLEPDPNLCRPIILIGAPGVGRRTLIRKLLNSDPSLYQPVVQHTTRLIRPGEVNSHDYHFVTKEEFERDIEQDRFLEYGEFRGHLYGTAFSSIKMITESKRIPVLDLHPQALKKIRHSGLKPYIIFVASPRLERLQLTRKVGSVKLKRRLGSSTHHADSDNAHIYTESDLQHLEKESRLIEAQYAHYFDWIIVNDDFQVAADMLKEVSRRVETEPQWVPATWKNY